MKAITIRDFRTRPRQVQNALADEPEALLTASGKPIAVLIPVDSGNVDETLAIIRRARAQQALQTIRTAAHRQGLDKLSLTEIDELVRKTRRGRGHK